MAKTLPPTKGMLTGGSVDTPPADGRADMRSADEINEAQRLLDAFLTGEGMAEAAYSLWAEETLDEILNRVLAQNTQIAPADRETVRGDLEFVVEQAYNEAQTIVDTMVDNPAALADMEDPGPLVTSILESSAQSFAGTTPTTPITTAAGNQLVIRGGAGVTVDIEQVINAGGQVFGEGGILDAVVPYIPGISLPDWMPSAGVIFLPSVGEAIENIGTIIENTDITDAIEEGDLGEILNDIGTIIVGAGGEVVGEVQEQINKIIGQIQGAIADPTRAGTIIGGVLAGSFPSGIPDWLGGILAENVGSAVYGAVRGVLVDSGTATEDQLPFAQEEEIVDINEDDTTLIDDTIKADIKFPIEPEPEPEPIGDGEVITQDPDKTDGQMGTAPVMDPVQPVPVPEPEPEPEPDTSVGDLFEDVLSQTEANILQGIADAGYATRQDIVDAINEAGLLTPENLATTLANAGFATPEDISTALASAGFATPEDIATALAAAGFTTPEDLVTALSNAGFATPEDIVTALSQSGLATPEDIATALTNAGIATPQDIADAFEAAGLATPQDITDAIAAAGLATPEDIANALAEFGFTDAQLEQIIGALPEGLSVSDLDTALEGIVVGEDLDTAVTTITDAIGGLDVASPDDIRSILANYGFTDAQLQQIVGALPEGLSLSEVTTALDTALSGIALGTDLDTATAAITDAIGGLAFATPADVANALADFGFSEDQLNQIAGVIPEGLSLNDLNTALNDALSGIALGTDLDTATGTITDAIGGLSFATAQDIQDALTGFNFTENQLSQISSLLPDNLTESQVQDLLNTALTGVSTQEDVDTAFETLTTNLNRSLSGLEEGQEDILTGQEGLLGGQEQIRDVIGEETQSLEDIIVTATGLLGALGSGGGAVGPRPQPYQKYLEKLDYAPEKVQMVQQTPKTDYQKEVDRLLMSGRAPQQPPRKSGMLV